ncbi:MAG: TetR/AcrR family transcriptional regulator [Solirubrobacterales bacterium]
MESAAELFRRQGYHGTGLNQVLEQSSAPRGSLYFHFPGGKQQLAAESVGEAGGAIGKAIEAILAATPDTGEAIGRVVDFLAADLSQSGFDHGCPVGTVAMDAASGSEPVRVACEAVFAGWLGLIARHLEAAGTAPDLAERQAMLAVSAIEGALLLARARRDTAALEAVGATLRPLLSPALTKAGQPGPKESR